MILSKQKMLIAGIGLLGLVLVIAVIALFGSGTPGNTPPPQPAAKIEVWGVFDGTDIIGPIARSFHERYPHLEVTYKKLTIEAYENELIDALAAGKGPDAYMINNTWVPRYLERIRTAPAYTFDAKSFRDAFVDIAFEDLVVNGSIVGVPLYMDTLALYYNKDYLASAGIALPPKTWDEFLDATKKLTRYDERGNITRAGAALGTAVNVNRAFDVVSLLMMQQGAEMIARDGSRAVFDGPLSVGSESFYPGERALTFYTDFANPRKQVYTWNALQHFSVDAFIEGNVAMMVNYARAIPTIESRAPYLKWDIAPMPQIATRDIDVNLGNYWALVVSNTTKSGDQAWQFLRYATERDQAAQYANAAGRPVARRDLIDAQRNDDKIGIFAVQGLSAKSWWQVDNRAIEEIFTEMIESVVKGADSARDAVAKASKQVSVLMRK
ncbi:MAG: extracellular solute-binding protein [bacterium]|nr:extracellular solute-binding protein [bacterium]